MFFASLWILLLINHWTQEHQLHCLGAPEGTLDVFITVAGEPTEMVEQTLRAAMEIDYANKQVTVLDDGRSPQIARLADYYGARYLTRKDRLHNKAGNLNNGLSHSSGEFVLTLDADQVPDPTIVRDLLGYFREDQKTAIVTTRQSFDVPAADFNHDRFFYDHIQAGKNADNAAISCGSGVFYRRTALNEIGGFQTWNLVEDLYTTYVLHSRGYRSIYVNKAYTKGTAPQDLETIYKQRGTWALDTLRLFFWRSPLTMRGLSLSQRLHYFEMAWAYIISAVVLPFVLLFPIISLILGSSPITDPMTYVLLRSVSLIIILFFFFYLSGRTFIGSCYWASLSPVYLKALILSFSPNKPKYHVTKKITSQGKREVRFIIPHLAFVLLAVSALLWRYFFVDHWVSPIIIVNAVWIVLMLFWFFPIIKKGLALDDVFGRIKRPLMLGRRFTKGVANG